MSYGTDTYCFDRIVTGRLATKIELLAQACYRRLTTPRGTLDDGEEGTVYGIDISDFIGRQTAPDAVASVPAVIEAELSKDDRVSSVSATATVVHGTDGLDAITVEAVVVPYDEDTSAFALTLAVSAVSVEVLGVTPV